MTGNTNLIVQAMQPLDNRRELLRQIACVHDMCMCAACSRQGLVLEH